MYSWKLDIILCITLLKKARLSCKISCYSHFFLIMMIDTWKNVYKLEIVNIKLKYKISILSAVCRLFVRGACVHERRVRGGSPNGSTLHPRSPSISSEEHVSMNDVFVEGLLTEVPFTLAPLPSRERRMCPSLLKNTGGTIAGTGSQNDQTCLT